MTDYNTIKNKSIAVLIWNKEKENDVHVYIGKIIDKEHEFHFINTSEDWDITLDIETVENLKEVPLDMKNTFLNADFFFSLSMADLPENFNEKEYNSTGLKWHE